VKSESDSDDAVDNDYQLGDDGDDDDDDDEEQGGEDDATVAEVGEMSSGVAQAALNHHEPVTGR